MDDTENLMISTESHFALFSNLKETSWESGACPGEGSHEAADTLMKSPP